MHFPLQAFFRSLGAGISESAAEGQHVGMVDQPYIAAGFAFLSHEKAQVS